MSNWVNTKYEFHGDEKQLAVLKKRLCEFWDKVCEDEEEGKDEDEPDAAGLDAVIDYFGLPLDGNMAYSGYLTYLDFENFPKTEEQWKKPFIRLFVTARWEPVHVVWQELLKKLGLDRISLEYLVTYDIYYETGGVKSSDWFKETWCVTFDPGIPVPGESLVEAFVYEDFPNLMETRKLFSRYWPDVAAIGAFDDFRDLERFKSFFYRALCGGEDAPDIMECEGFFDYRPITLDV